MTTKDIINTTAQSKLKVTMKHPDKGKVEAFVAIEIELLGFGRITVEAPAWAWKNGKHGIVTDDYGQIKRGDTVQWKINVDGKNRLNNRINQYYDAAESKSA